MSECILSITAGDGPKECQWVVVKLAHAYCNEAKTLGLNARILWEGDEKTTAQSCLLEVQGSEAKVFAESRLGTVRWVGQSPFRKNHKRKNWYVGVSKAPSLDDVPELLERDIRYQTLKASGPGGQHVNKTESAVRATHIPTGLTVVSQEDRSQFANKRLTRVKLAMLLKKQRDSGVERQKEELWSSHKSLERGNEVRVYEGNKFRIRS